MTVFRHLTLAIALLISEATFAQATSPLVYLQTGFDVGIQGGNYLYDEPDVMSLSGRRYGLTGSYTYVGKDANFDRKWRNYERPVAPFGRLEVRGSRGRLNYNSNSTGSMDNVPDQIVEGRALVGFTDPLSENFSLSPFVGFGYRRLNNDLRGTSTTGHVGYRRESRYTYIPAGFLTRWHVGHQWVLVSTLETDVVGTATQTSRLSDTNIPGLQDVTVSQRKTPGGYRMSSFIEKGPWSLGIWMNTWKFLESDVETAGTIQVYEPKNKTRETGLELRYHF